MNPYGTQLDPKFVVVNEKMNWSSAQKHCRENYIDLATVRNDAEHKQVYDLVPVVAWIGLFRDPNFHWSDGSSFVFSHFDDAPDTYGLLRVRAMCAAAFLNRSGKWRFLFCETRLPFVCYNPQNNRLSPP
uniref:C-type lectin domain-containing protein n=1 Tax=Amphiprion percula TaxID=161767 RepID=A0A3P8T8W1_AMPPE